MTEQQTRRVRFFMGYLYFEDASYTCPSSDLSPLTRTGEARKGELGTIRLSTGDGARARDHSGVIAVEPLTIQFPDDWGTTKGLAFCRPAHHSRVHRQRIESNCGGAYEHALIHGD